MLIAMVQMSTIADAKVRKRIENRKLIVENFDFKCYFFKNLWKIEKNLLYLQH